MNYIIRNVFPADEDNMQVSILEFPALPSVGKLVPALPLRWHVIYKDLDSGNNAGVTICASYEKALELAKVKFKAAV